MRLVTSTVLIALLLVGCTHNTTLLHESDGAQVIYRLSEAQAFTIALDAYAEVLPKQSLFDITGPRRGYQATWRFGLDRYSQKVLVIPAVGVDASGNKVEGYWFDVSGSGTAGVSGSLKNRELFRRLKEALDATGTATQVTNVQEGRYETDGQAYRAQGRDASEAAVKSRPSRSSPVADQLRELKALHEQGLITKEEYEAKRLQILNRM